MGEHRPYKAKVAGSSPAAPTIGEMYLWSGSSVGLEFRPVKPGVAGSSPVHSAIFPLSSFYTAVNYEK